MPNEEKSFDREEGRTDAEGEGKVCAINIENHHSTQNCQAQYVC